MNIAVSACLLGEACRYDGKSVPCEAVGLLRDRHKLVPICPELAGGLEVPRLPSEIITQERVLRVLNSEGEDVTALYLQGAGAALELAQREGCKLAVLKAKSPACGNGTIYDGSFSGTLVPGYGAAARLFRDAGIRVFSELQLQKLLAVSERLHSEAMPAALAETSAECPVLETGRLVLRAITLDDAPDVFAYCSDPDIGADAGWPMHRSIEDSRSFVTEIANAPHTFGVFEKLPPSSSCSLESEGGAATGPCIGTVGLIPDPHRKNVDSLMLGYALAKQAWGRGLMSEAAREVLRYGFEELGLDMLSVTHYAFNQRSRRVIEKCGFALEGRLRAVEPGVDGALQDMMLYSMTKSEWDHLHAKR